MPSRTVSPCIGPDRVYLDANATFGPIPEVAELLRTFDPATLGNPSSVHRTGQRARAVIEEVRAEVRTALSLAAEDSVIFTSGATEANNAVFQGVRALAYAHRDGRGLHAMVSAIEHPSVLEPARALRTEGWLVDEVTPPSLEDPFAAEQFAGRLSPDTRLVSVMLANNETGELLPVRDVFAAARVRSQAFCHSDITQALGRMPLSLSSIGADAVSLSGHKLGALSGVGALVLRGGVELAPTLLGGPQEERRRAGTENVLGIATLGVALRAMRRDLDRRIGAFQRTRDALVDALLEHVADVSVVRSAVPRIPNTACLRIRGVSAADLVVALDCAGVELSFGAACASGKPDPSPTLRALGLSEDDARECLRVSVRAEYQPGAIEYATCAMVEAIQRARDQRRGITGQAVGSQEIHG